MSRHIFVVVGALASLVSSCGEREEAPQEPLEIPEPEETDSPEPKAHMQEHDVASLRARDAVVAGTPSAAREPLAWLAGHIYPETLPPHLRPHAQRMQAAARAGLSAATLPDAAAALGTLAATCGACHREIDGGPRRTPSGFEVELDQDLPERMHRHAWAVERMWEGLITPWEKSWTAGAQVLSEGRLASLSQPDTYSESIRSQLEHVRVLGRKALRERSWPARAKVYGELIATCAACHRELGVELAR